EAVIVVRGLPDPQRSSGRLEVGEAVPAPELLLIDAVAPLDFAVLLRASGPDVPMADPRECGIRVVPRVPDRLRRWALHRRVSLDASVASAAHCCGSAAGRWQFLPLCRNGPVVRPFHL